MQGHVAFGDFPQLSFLKGWNNLVNKLQVWCLWFCIEKSPTVCVSVKRGQVSTITVYISVMIIITIIQRIRHMSTEH